MSSYKNFAVVGVDITGNFIVRQLLKDKAAGTVNEVIVLTRQVSLVILGQTLPTHQGSKTFFDGDARVISADYLNKQPIKDAARWGGYRCLYHLICSSWRARTIAEAAKEADAKLFTPSEFGVSS
jgi:hypothetical protein